jgi:hypothetical protein
LELAVEPAEERRDSFFLDGLKKEVGVVVELSEGAALISDVVRFLIKAGRAGSEATLDVVVGEGN